MSAYNEVIMEAFVKKCWYTLPAHKKTKVKLKQLFDTEIKDDPVFYRCYLEFSRQFPKPKSNEFIPKGKSFECAKCKKIINQGVLNLGGYKDKCEHYEPKGGEKK